MASTSGNSGAADWSFQEFYNAFHSCPVTKLAAKAGELSTDVKYLSKYLTVAKKALDIKEEHNHCSTEFDNLLKLQKSNGKWESLSAVLNCLDLPEDLTLNGVSQWEAATAFAVASIRQRIDLFDILADYHDRGFVWLQSKRLIQNATELIAEARAQGRHSIKKRNNYHEVSQYLTANCKDSTIIDDKFEKAKKGNFSELKSINAKKTVNSDSGNTFQPVITAQLIDSPQICDAIDKTVITSLTSIPREVYSANESYNYMDMSKKLDLLKMTVIQFSVELDQHLQLVIRCKNRCLERFQRSQTQSERHSCFDELNAMIGEGVAPRPGFDDWRKYGAKGYRPLCVKLLCAIHNVAEERLNVMESRSRPKTGVVGNQHGSSISMGNSALPTHSEIVEIRSRWNIIWNGEDILQKTLKNLDFLRDCSQLVNWYGRKYPFLKNPLTLPFCYDKAVTMLHMEEKINEQVQNKPFFRLPYPRDSWQFHKYVQEWKSDLANLFIDRCSWWPEPPDFLNETYMKDLYTAMLVLLVNCSSEISQSAILENKMNRALADAHAKKLLKRSLQSYSNQAQVHGDNTHQMTSTIITTAATTATTTDPAKYNAMTNQDSLQSTHTTNSAVNSSRRGSQSQVSSTGTSNHGVLPPTHMKSANFERTISASELHNAAISLTAYDTNSTTTNSDTTLQTSSKKVSSNYSPQSIFSPVSTTTTLSSLQTPNDAYQVPKLREHSPPPSAAIANSTKTNKVGFLGRNSVSSHSKENIHKKSGLTTNTTLKNNEKLLPILSKQKEKSKVLVTDSKLNNTTTATMMALTPLNLKKISKQKAPVVPTLDLGTRYDNSSNYDTFSMGSNDNISFSKSIDELFSKDLLGLTLKKESDKSNSTINVRVTSTTSIDSQKNNLSSQEVEEKEGVEVIAENKRKKKQKLEDIKLNSKPTKKVLAKELKKSRKVSRTSMSSDGIKFTRKVSTDNNKSL